MNLVLAEKPVIVTGAGQGLGRAYALAAAAAGAAVVVNDVADGAADEVVAEIQHGGGTAVAAAGSVADPRVADELVASCVRRFGRVYGLVNNAGVLYENPAWATTNQQSKTMVEVNVLGSVYCGHAVIRRLREQATGGSIVNITSGTHLGQPGLAVYGATKGAIASLTYGWALDLHGTGIRVNALSPLAVTRMKLPPYDGHALPDDIASVVLYLLSDDSAAVTGQLVRRARDQLGLIAHPRIGTMLTGTWTFERIREAFDHELRTQLEPIGFGSHLVDFRQLG